MADLDFYYLQDSYNYIIEEGFFHVPEKVLKDIKDFYIENYKQYLKNNRGKISRRLYPPKDFKLDFTGTKFEFLNFRNPSITVYLTSKSSYYHDYNHDKEDTMELYNHGNIYLQLNPNIFRRILMETIEHEVMHYIQSLMNSLHNQYGAGFPNKKLWRKNVDPHGFSLDGSGRTRVSHTQRPIEYYPDLLTAIRILFQDFYKRTKDYQFSEEEKIEYKKNFFTSFLNAVNNTENTSNIFDEDLCINSFREFKKISPEFYKKMIKISYDAFVNGEPNFNPKEIEKKLRMIELDDSFNKLKL
jgi:hypothetical protein